MKQNSDSQWAPMWANPWICTGNGLTGHPTCLGVDRPHHIATHETIQYQRHVLPTEKNCPQKWWPNIVKSLSQVRLKKHKTCMIKRQRYKLGMFTAISENWNLIFLFSSFFVNKTFKKPMKVYASLPNGYRWFLTSFFRAMFLGDRGSQAKPSFAPTGKGDNPSNVMSIYHHDMKKQQTSPVQHFPPSLGEFI